VFDHHTEPLLAKLEKYKDAALGQTRIDAVQLIQSQLKPHGAEYTVLHRTSRNRISHYINHSPSDQG